MYIFSVHFPRISRQLPYKLTKFESRKGVFGALSNLYDGVFLPK